MFIVTIEGVTHYRLCYWGSGVIGVYRHYRGGQVIGVTIVMVSL